MRFSSRLAAVALVAVVVSTIDTTAQQPIAGEFVSGEILVKFRPGATGSERADAHRQGGGNEIAEIQRTRVQRVQVPAGGEAAAIERYGRNPSVLSAEPNFVRGIPQRGGRGKLNSTDVASVAPDDHHFGQQWGLHNSGQSFYCFGTLCFYAGTADADIDAPEAWAITTGGFPVTVAVIDSGIDYTHPDLAPNYLGGEDFITLDGDPMDDHGHGTHVAGTIAAAMNNLTGTPGAAEGVVGVAPRAFIRAYKVCGPDGSCSDFAIQQAIARAITDGAQVINMSLGSQSYSQSLDEAVQDAWNAGLVIVGGAGNNGTTQEFYPAALNNVVAVAAFDEDHRRPSFSNYGSWVDISAPGNAIVSTYPAFKCTTSTTPGDIGCYAFLTGTSMAAPHVAGAAALVWSHGAGSNAQVVDMLLGSADPIGVGGVRLDSWTIHGGLNLHAALGFSSTRPVADAGADQSITDNDDDGAETVDVDGSASFDPNGSIVSYEWLNGSTSIASTAAAAVSLPVGVHVLTLKVTDNDGEIGTDTVTIAVNPTRQITVVASTPQATEAGTGSGMFTISRTGDTSLPLTVFYTVEGTATPASDYQTLSGQVTLDAGAPSATVAVVPIDDSDNESNETVVLTVLADGAYRLGTPISATVTIVSDDLPPDMVVTSVAAPDYAAANADIVVTETTKNQGGGSAAASTTGFYLSTNSALDAADVFLGTRAAPALAPSATDTATTTLRLPDVPADYYYVLAKADFDGMVPETSETNNVRASGVVRVGPDLIVTALSVPSTAGAGSAFSASDTTKNQGGGGSSSSTTRFYLSVNSGLDGSDVLLGSRATPPLAAGATHTAATTLTIPAGTATGSYYVIAEADGGDAVLETNESNNLRVTSVKIGPDLIVSSMSAPASATAGTAVTVTDSTRNQGAGTAAPSSTGFYLSTNSTIGSGDVFLGSRLVNALAAGSTASGSTQVQIPADTAPGTYYIVARADWADVVEETTDTNNDRSSSSIKIGGDLVVSALTVSSSPDGSVTVTDTTKNQGLAPVAASATGFYLSINSSYSSDDAFLGSRAAGALGPSQTSSATTELTIPQGLPAGSYYVIAVADWDDAVPETSETNNTRAAGSVRIGPDLTVTALTASPSSAAAGTAVTVSDTTTNQGSDPMPASITYFYLGRNSVLDSTAVLITTREVPSLAPGASSSGSVPLAIPAGTGAGVYYIIAKADGDNAHVESLESNNTRVRSLWITD